MKPPKPLAGKLTISRTSSNHDNPRPITITLHDVLSGREVVEIRVGLTEFAETLTGLSRMKCEFDLGDTARAGKRHEYKHEAVFIPGKPWDDREVRERLARKVFALFEVDGWVGDIEDVFNSHRRIDRVAKDGDWYQVMFHRWVKIEEDTADAR